jgi:hypothetical protein
MAGPDANADAQLLVRILREGIDFLAALAPPSGEDGGDPLNTRAFLRTLVTNFPELRVFVPEGAKETPEDAGTAWGPSVALYGRAFPEFDKAVVALKSHWWLFLNDRQNFVSVQPPGASLTANSWNQARACACNAVQLLALHLLRAEPGLTVDRAAREAQMAAAYVTVVNAVGRTAAVRARALGPGPGAVAGIGEHDKVLARLLEDPALRAEYLPSLGGFPGAAAACITRSCALRFTPLQFLQAECPAASLGPLVEARAAAEAGSPDLPIRLLAALTDLAGAGGHVRASGSLTLTEATWGDFNAMAGCALDGGLATPEATYSAYLGRRWAGLGGGGEGPALRVAYTRACCWLRGHAPADLDLVRQAFAALPAEVAAELVAWLGDPAGPLLSHAPAILLNAQAPPRGVATAASPARPAARVARVARTAFALELTARLVRAVGGVGPADAIDASQPAAWVAEYITGTFNAGPHALGSPDPAPALAALRECLAGLCVAVRLAERQAVVSVRDA